MPLAQFQTSTDHSLEILEFVQCRAGILTPKALYFACVKGEHLSNCKIYRPPKIYFGKKDFCWAFCAHSEGVDSNARAIAESPRNSAIFRECNCAVVGWHFSARRRKLKIILHLTVEAVDTIALVNIVELSDGNGEAEGSQHIRRNSLDRRSTQVSFDHGHF